MTDEKIKRLFDQIKATDFISKNKFYKTTADSTTISMSNENVVNAYATSSGSALHINIFSGLIYIAYVASYACATKDFNTIRKCLHAAGKKCNQKKGDFTFLDATKIINKYCKVNDLIINEGDSYTDGALIYVIAHELGHICLHHTHSSRGGRSLINSMSRNNERCADLFASSIIEAMNYPQYMFIGNIIMILSFAWMSDDEDVATTHPYTKERFDYIYNSHIELINSFGFTREVFDSLLPKKKDKK